MKLFKFKRKKKLDTKKKNKGTDPYFEIGKLVREARIGRNLSINDLASAKKLSISLLEGGQLIKDKLSSVSST